MINNRPSSFIGEFLQRIYLVLFIRFKSKISVSKSIRSISTIALLLIGFSGFAQNPGDAGNFGIRSNVYSGTPTANTDDWFQGPTGFGVIDETNTATYAGYLTPLSNTPFLVGPNFYTIHIS